MRRLKENRMLEAEITPAGDVMVEGHHVGMLQGFRFTPDPQAEGAEAQALRGAAQKALATAISERAALLARAGDRDIVLSLDAHLRWQGEPVARLIAGDDVLKPRLVILADEQLSGLPREQVETRLNAWLTSHIGTLLKPLIDLSADQTITGMARGIAFQLVENLGVLERRAVLEEVRGLSQDERGLLRRHGVRFGAYHIYVPHLLKPASSTLAALLWALKHRDLVASGLAEMQAVSGSGRTSVATDTTIDHELYRRFGFRIYGSRAIRIDILERLADLIRPALAWRPGATAEAPAGAMPEGGGFTVTPAMTSLLGASGEDFSVILRGLGYRMERRPKPIETPAAAPQPDAVADAPAAAASEPGDTPAEEPPVEEPPVEEPQIEPPSEAPPSPDAPLEEPPATEPVPETPPQEEPPLAEATAIASMEPTAPAEPARPAEPETIEVWRIGRPPREARKPRGDRRPPGAHRGERQGDGEEKRGLGFVAKPRGSGKSRRKGRDDGRDENRREATQRNDRPRPPRERPVDPDSPFAALQALKKELEKRE
jgi:ATP-dependent RNA helicase SUPV3L1/SUV3